jgi:hypothetical protein
MKVGGRRVVAPVWLCLATAVAPACGPDVGDGGPAGGSAFELELMAADRAFNQATQAEGSGGWVRFFDPQGAMIQANRGEFRGLEAVQAAVASLDEPGFTLTWEPLRAQGSDDGTLGYTVGRYQSRTVLAGDTTFTAGIYVSIWRRQPDGSLKVVMDLGNPVTG